MAFSSGTKLGRYEIRAKIGEGGMGEVYLARDTQLDRDVAVKVLPSTYSVDANHGSAGLDQSSEGELSYLIQSIDLRGRNAWH